MLSQFSWDNRISMIAVIVSLIALGVAWNTAHQEAYRNTVDARISNCANIASVYAGQSWAYRIDNQKPDPDLAEYSDKSMAISRASQLCRNQHSSAGALRECVAKFVDDPISHKVTEIGSDGNNYENLVC